MNLKEYEKRSIVLNYRIFLSLRYFKIVILSILFTGISTLSIYAETISAQQFDVAKQKLADQNIAKEILSKGQDQWKKGELEKALITLEEAVDFDPSNKQIVKVFKSMQNQKKRIDGLLNEASDFIDKSNYQEAKKSLENASIIQIQYIGYQRVLQEFIDAKKKTRKKITDTKQKRIASLVFSSKNFQETAAKNYAKALLLLSKDIGKLQLYNIDNALWDTDTSQFGWMTFFNSAISIYNKNPDGFPIVGYYNPYSDILLITIWAEEKNIYKIVDAEILMGYFLHGSSQALNFTPLWLQEKRDYKASLGLSVARTVFAFENIFSSVTYKNWREKLKILHHKDIIDGFNYSGVSIMANSNLLNILNYINPKEDNLRLIKINKFVSKIIRLLSIGKTDEVLAISKAMSAKNIKLLKGISQEWYKTLKISAVISDSDESFVLLSPSKQTNYSLCITIKHMGNNGSEVQIDLIGFQYFYDLLKVNLDKLQKGDL